MANNNSKKKTNTNNKNNTKKTDTNKKVSEVKNTNTTKKVEKENNNNKKGINTKKEVKKVTPKEEIKVEKIVKEKVTPEVKKEKSTFKLTSKQRDIILVLLVAVVLIIALVLTGGKKLDIELPIALEGTPGFTEISYAEYEEKLNAEAPFLVVIINDGCGYCEMYEPIVEEVAEEYNLPIYYINLANLTSEEYSALSSSNTYLKKNQWGTPTTLFMYGNAVVDSIGGYVDKETFVEFVKENFVVTENE